MLTRNSATRQAEVYVCEGEEDERRTRTASFESLMNAINLATGAGVPLGFSFEGGPCSLTLRNAWGSCSQQHSKIDQPASRLA